MIEVDLEESWQQFKDYGTFHHKERNMLIKVDKIIKQTASPAEYLPYSDNILSVVLKSKKQVAVDPDGSGFYPVLIDLYEDGTIKEFEILTRVSSWHVDFGLQAPSPQKVGDVVISEDENHAPCIPVFWTDSEYSLLFIEFISRPNDQTQHIQVADKVIVDVDGHNIVTGMWFLHLPSEIRQKRPAQGLQVFDFSDNTMVFLTNIEQTAKGREKALNFALSQQLDSQKLCSKIKQINRKTYDSSQQRAHLSKSSHQIYGESYLNGLVEVHHILTEQNGSKENVFSLTRQEMFYARGQKEAAMLALQSQGGAYQLQIALEEAEQKGEEASNCYVRAYQSGYLSGVKNALKIISSGNLMRN